MLIRLITGPASEPVTLQQAKSHLRLDDATDDAYVTDLITAARAYTEQVMWRGLLLQTYEIALPGFLGADRFELPARRNFSSAMVGYEWTNTDRAYRFFPYLELPMGQLAASSPIVAFTYLDPNGATQTLDTSVYELDTYSVPGRVRLKDAQTWPLTLDHWNSVVIRYSVGWAGTGTDLIPQPIKQALLILIAQMYENRVPELATRALVPVAFAYNALISPYRLNRI
jgi:hypothetical protein